LQCVAVCCRRRRKHDPKNFNLSVRHFFLGCDLFAKKSVVNKRVGHTVSCISCRSHDRLTDTQTHRNTDTKTHIHIDTRTHVHTCNTRVATNFTEPLILALLRKRATNFRVTLAFVAFFSNVCVRQDIQDCFVDLFCLQKNVSIQTYCPHCNTLHHSFANDCVLQRLFTREKVAFNFAPREGTRLLFYRALLQKRPIILRKGTRLSRPVLWGGFG